MRNTKAKTPLQARGYLRDANGIDNEQRVLTFLHNKGCDVLDSERAEDIYKDIDAYIDGVGTSIKTQNAGVKFGNICLELCTQHYTGIDWTPEHEAFCREWFPLGDLNISVWRPSWFLWGAADQYIISQKYPEGRRLRYYKKATINAVIRQKGFQRVRGLKASTLRGQNGKNTVSGYLALDDVPHFKEEWMS